MGTSGGFEWDDAKAEANLAKHKVAFGKVVAVFDDPFHVVVSTARAEDGEDREKAIGEIDGQRFMVVFVMRGDNRRLISARRANPGEESIYGNSLF